MASDFLKSLNLKRVCAEYRVSLWQCPQFLFLIMGIVIILSILVTYTVASYYEEPEIASLIVLVLTGILFSLGHIIIKAFERVALAARSKSEFISIMSHQLRSPLSSIKWQLDLLLSERMIQKLSRDALQKYLQEVYYQNERMIRSVNDLLEVNRIEDEELILRPTLFSIKDMTEKMIKEYLVSASASNVEIKIRADQDLPQIMADEERIKHVVEHLVDNAIKYSLTGGKIFIDMAKNNGRVTWKIADSGAGIDLKDQKRIFEKFFRSDSAARYQTKGNGIGLFIVKSIIEKSGGKIGFSSIANKGSTFWFSLPATKGLLQIK